MLASLFAGALLFATTGAASPSATPSTEVHHPSGITLLYTLPPTPPPLPTDLALALDEADRASAADPQNLAFPWVDRSSGTLVVAASTAAGRSEAAGFQPQHAAASSSIRVAAAKHSRAYIQKIMDETIGFGPQARVELTAPDPANDRAVLWVDGTPSDAYLYGLAARYDPSAIAVYVLPHPLNDRPLIGRNSDNTPFWGGARIYANTMACTDAFSWTVGTSNYYSLTAGHC